MGKDIIEGGDLFCGGSGSSTAFTEACKSLGKPHRLVAVNHNPLAIRTHRVNHPHAKHFCQDIRTVEPREAVPSGHLDLMLAGMPCPQYSLARGGRPYDQQERMLPWEIVRWLSELDVNDVILENVQQFLDWGPLIQKVDQDGRPVMDPKTGKPWMIPDPARLGEHFQEFIGKIRALGYSIEWQILNSADYGAATIRRRLFILCRKHRPVMWPDKTHTKEHYIPARDIIDWSIHGESIFTRKKQLADATLRRIFTGIRRYGPVELEPFFCMLYGTGTTRSIRLPVPTVTAGGGKGGGHIALCQFILQQQSGGVARDIGQPLPTIATSGAQALVQAVLKLNGKNGTNGHGHPDPAAVRACPPFLVPNFGEREGQTPRTHSIDDPTPTVTSHGAGCLVEPFLMPVNHGKNEMRTHSIREPMRTITGWDAWALIEPQVMKYFGTGIAKPVCHPLDTVTTHDRFALVQPAVTEEIGLDILFRMLQPHELQRAMGFSKDYKFLGSRRDVVKMIGNSWEGHTARALCMSMLMSA